MQYPLIYIFFLIWFSKWECSGELRAGFTHTRAKIKAGRGRCRPCSACTHNTPSASFHGLWFLGVSQRVSEASRERVCRPRFSNHNMHAISGHENQRTRRESWVQLRQTMPFSYTYSLPSILPVTTSAPPSREDAAAFVTRGKFSGCMCS